MLAKVKLALRLTTSAYDNELIRLIFAAKADLGFADVIADTNAIDPAIEQAIITYVRLNFGSPEDYDRLARSYWEQKAQLQMREHGMRGRYDPCNYY